jgi:hypothetical protein
MDLEELGRSKEHEGQPLIHLIQVQEEPNSLEGKALNGSFDVGLLEFGLVMQVKEWMLFTIKIVDELEPEIEAIHYM